MDISYNKLFKLLTDRWQGKTEAANAVGISANTMAKMARNEMVSMKVIVKICRYLSCTADGIFDIFPKTLQAGGARNE